jgi:hypothetical protein
MDKLLRIEGVQVDLEALSKDENQHHIDELFSHLPESKKALAHDELNKALAKYKDSPQKEKITVETSNTSRVVTGDAVDSAAANADAQTAVKTKSSKTDK